MVLRDRDVSTFRRTLEVTPKGLDGIRVYVAAHKFLFGMNDFPSLEVFE